ncbi:hypothetical protein Trydic_g9544 [Trypoxylus dichotomus]
MFLAAVAHPSPHRKVGFNGKKVTKILKTKEEKIPPILRTRGIINNNSDKTEEFANYFGETFRPNPPVDRDHEKFTEVINKQVHTECRDTINVQETTTEELRDVIKTLRDRKAPGHDGITNTAIKHLTLEAVDMLKVLPEDVETCYNYNHT